MCCSAGISAWHCLVVPTAKTSSAPCLDLTVYASQQIKQSCCQQQDTNARAPHHSNSSSSSSSMCKSPQRTWQQQRLASSLQVVAITVARFERSECSRSLAVGSWHAAGGVASVAAAAVVYPKSTAVKLPVLTVACRCTLLLCGRQSDTCCCCCPRHCVLLHNSVQEAMPPSLRHVHLVPEQVLAIPRQRRRLHDTRPSAVPT
jgi:hypothetical protein